MVFLRPTYLIDGDITDIKLDELKEDGIKGIILDLDSTLIAPRSGKLTADAASWLESARSSFKLAVVSNNKRVDYIAKTSDLLAMPVIGAAGKPRARELLKTLALLDLKPQEAVLVGDRPLTDILGGQRAGMKTILVYPLKTMNEPKWIQFFRWLERLVIKI
jgi:HAD superfamily phosphatase (TIGR01668 family)